MTSVLSTCISADKTGITKQANEIKKYPWRFSKRLFAEVNKLKNLDPKIDKYGKYELILRIIN